MAKKMAAPVVKKKATLATKNIVVASSSKEKDDGKKPVEPSSATLEKEASGKKPMEPSSSGSGSILMMCHHCFVGNDLCLNWLHHGERCFSQTPSSSFNGESSSVRAKVISLISSDIASGLGYTFDSFTMDSRLWIRVLVN